MKTSSSETSDYLNLVCEHALPYVRKFVNGKRYKTEHCFDPEFWTETTPSHFEYGKAIRKLEKAGGLPIVWVDRDSENHNAYERTTFTEEA